MGIKFVVEFGLFLTIVRNDNNSNTLNFLSSTFWHQKVEQKVPSGWLIQRIWDSVKLISQNSSLCSSNRWLMCLWHHFTSPPNSFFIHQMLGIFKQEFSCCHLDKQRAERSVFALVNGLYW